MMELLNSNYKVSCDVLMFVGITQQSAYTLSQIEHSVLFNYILMLYFDKICPKLPTYA